MLEATLDAAGTTLVYVGTFSPVCPSLGTLDSIGTDKLLLDPVCPGGNGFVCCQF
jgi:hypothetical protein